MSQWWPVRLSADRPDGTRVQLRGLRRRDRREWQALRDANVEWLREWESTVPQPSPRRLGYGAVVRMLDQEGKAGRMLPFAVEVDGRLAGQMHLFGVTWGSLRSAAAGYWVDGALAGRGITPFALGMLVDHAIHDVGLHRVEVNIRPDNAASLRVVDKLGFRDEGVRSRYLHINGAWHDHRTFALTAEDLGGRRLVESAGG